jgi:HK97 family phage prohead protease
MALAYERTFDLEDISINRSGDGRTVTAYAAVFDQDAEIRDQHGHYVEQISRTAFNRTLTMKPVDKIGVLYNHGYDTSGRPNMVGSVPIGTPLEIRADARGLLTVTRYNRSQMADAVLEAIRDGQIKGQSFRGLVHKDEPGRPNARGLKSIVRTELGLSEYGPTHSPAYEGSGILAIRSQDDLAELVRTMIHEMSGTPLGLAATTATPPGPGPTEDPAPRHSRKIEAMRNANRVRALSLGVIRAEAAQEH